MSAPRPVSPRQRLVTAYGLWLLGGPLLLHRYAPGGWAAARRARRLCLAGLVTLLAGASLLISLGRTAAETGAPGAVVGSLLTVAGLGLLAIGGLGYWLADLVLMPRLVRAAAQPVAPAPKTERVSSAPTRSRRMRRNRSKGTR